MRARPSILSVSLIAAVACLGQGSIRDTSITIVPITVSYAYQVPGADMAQRFGNNSNIGLSAAVKFKSNYLLGVDGGFLFGDNVLEPGLLSGVANSDGEILDADGQAATILVYERGYTIIAWAGKILPVIGPNPNCGLLIKAGGGYMRHKIRIETQENVVPQLEGDYLTGYDRLCAGPAAMLLFGYQHFGNRRLLNYMFGFEMTYGFTESLRAFNFDTGTSQEGTRFDVLTGFRAGWTLPIYKRKAEGVYMY